MKSSVKVLLLKKAEKIIAKYKDHPMTEITGTLLPVIINEKLNGYLKEVARYVGVKKNIAFHMSRHTIDSKVILSNGIPIETVSKLLDYSKISPT